MEETKVIDINRYKSRVESSPLLSGKTVEVKAYTQSFSQNSGAGNTIQAPTNTTPPPPVEKPVNPVPPVEPQTFAQHTEGTEVKQPTNPFIKQPDPVFEQNQFSGNEFAPPPPGFEDDGIDPMSFGESPNMNPTEDEDMPTNAANASAMMMISMYSMMVPPIIYGMIKNDITEFNKVMSHNNQVPDRDINNILKFLQSQNKEIENALKLTREQVQLLKQALAAVIRQYKIAPENPIVNLLIVVIGIAISQFFAIKQIMAAQEEQLTNFITQFKVVVPEDAGIKKKTKIIIKKSNLRDAA